MAATLDTLEYAKRLRHCGFTEQQAEGQAHALAAMMTDSLATKEDFAAFGARFDGADKQIEIRLEELEKRLAVRFGEIDRRFGELDRRLEELDRGLQTTGHRLSGLESAVGAVPTREELDSRLREMDARITGEFADLERRLTLRLGGIMVAGIGAMSALLRLL